MYCLPGYKTFGHAVSYVSPHFLKNFVGNLCSLFNGLLAHKCWALVTSNKQDSSVCFLVTESSVNSTKGFFGKTKIHKSRQILRKKKVRTPPDLACEFLRVARTRQDAQNFLPLVNFGSFLLRMIDHQSTHFSKLKHKHHAYDISTMWSIYPFNTLYMCMVNGWL
jgi:hypothetical protein